MAIADKVCEDADRRIGSVPEVLNAGLQRAGAIIKLSKALDERLQQLFCYGAIEGETLVFYFAHPAAKMEFERDREGILERMRTIYKKEGLSKGALLFRRVEAKVKARAPKRNEAEPRAPDRARGEFEIQAKDDQIRRKFEQIRQNIKGTG